MKLFDSSFTALERALDVRFKRHTVLTGNIANGETPNYRARELDFAGTLKQALNANNKDLAKTDPGHQDIGGEGQPFITFDNSGAVGSDGNNVDLDITMGKISENARSYSSAANYLSLKLRLLRMATRDRGGV